MANWRPRYLASSVQDDLRRKMVFLGGPPAGGQDDLGVGRSASGRSAPPRYLNWDDPQGWRLLAGALPPLPPASLLLARDRHQPIGERSGRTAALWRIPGAASCRQRAHLIAWNFDFCATRTAARWISSSCAMANPCSQSQAKANHRSLEGEIRHLLARHTRRSGIEGFRERTAQLCALTADRP